MEQLEGSGKLKKFDDLIRTRTCDLLAYSIVQQLSTLLHAPVRSHRGANADSDNYFVITKTEAKIRLKYVPNKEKAIRYNINNLKQKEVEKEYEQKLQTYVSR
jgi:hypothetical protein